jgi:hypothetical protein
MQPIAKLLVFVSIIISLEAPKYYKMGGKENSSLSC